MIILLGPTITLVRRLGERGADNSAKVKFTRLLKRASALCACSVVIFDDLADLTDAHSTSFALYLRSCVHFILFAHLVQSRVERTNCTIQVPYASLVNGCQTPSCVPQYEVVNVDVTWICACPLPKNAICFRGVIFYWYFAISRGTFLQTKDSGTSPVCMIVSPGGFAFVKASS